MSEFVIKAKHPKTGAEKTFKYNNITSELTDSFGRPFSIAVAQKKEPFFATSVDTPASKSKKIETLKIQLGLSCNYECSYCNQRFVPHADETNMHDVDPFIENLPKWFDGGPNGDGTGVKIEFWGGEPLVYWKTLKPLAEKLRERYPNVEFGMVTNASILSLEINEWLDNMNFGIGISHDGPGYHVRGLDPFDDPEKFALIKDLYDRLKKTNRISFNAMLNKDNMSRAEISKWFFDKFGEYFVIGEGEFIAPYDKGGVESSLQTNQQKIDFRNLALKEIKEGTASNFHVINAKLNDFLDSIKTKRNALTLGQKCGMDNQHQLAVDLRGNVLTCQNVSEVSIGPNGESHKIGHVSDFNNIKLKTSTHFTKREGCMNCPVLQICKGACMFLHGPLFEVNCDNSYSDSIPFFCAGIEKLTGYTPYYIEGPQPDDRKDILGIVNGIPEDRPKKKVIPIAAL